jgi:hypothetical protein
MKYLILSVILLSATCFAKDNLKSFQEELLTEVKSEINNDDYRLKDKKLGRGPASIKETQHPRFETVPKIDKSVRQTGLADW